MSKKELLKQEKLKEIAGGCVRGSYCTGKPQKTTSRK